MRGTKDIDWGRARDRFVVDWGWDVEIIVSTTPRPPSSTCHPSPRSTARTRRGARVIERSEGTPGEQVDGRKLGDTKHVGTMSFSLPVLPYEYASLEPYIDATTMNIHHTKHHQAYINNLNGAIEKTTELKGKTLEEIVQEVSSVPAEVKTVVRNNGGGHWNHCFFWKCMTSPSDTAGPMGELKEAIEQSFGSIDEMKAKFNAAAAGRFGSGWAWLGCKDDGSLVITSTPNQDNPMMSGLAEEVCKPVLGLDVWEHAYYLKYQNRRPEYIANFWNVVNWEYLSESYQMIKAGGTAKI